jgi:hypothetical protein
MLLSLPYDIIRSIGFHLTVEDLINYANSSTVIYHVVSNNDFSQSYYNVFNSIKQYGYCSADDFIKMVPGNNWLHSLKILSSRMLLSCEISLLSPNITLHLYPTDTIETFVTRTRNLITNWLFEEHQEVKIVDVYISNYPFNNTFLMRDTNCISDNFLTEASSIEYTGSLTVYINMNKALPNIKHSLIKNIKVGKCLPIASDSSKEPKISRVRCDHYLIDYFRFVYIVAV